MVFNPFNERPHTGRLGSHRHSIPAIQNDNPTEPKWRQEPFASAACHQEEVLKNIGFPMASELNKGETNLLSREQVMYQFAARTAAEEGSRPLS